MRAAGGEGTVEVLGSSAERVEPAMTTAPSPPPAPTAPPGSPEESRLAAAREPRAPSVAVVATSETLDPPMLATPTFVERVVERFPDIPPLPTRPLVEEPAFPLVIVAAVALFVAITSRGDRRDPKLTRAQLDARDREVGFS